MKCLGCPPKCTLQGRFAAECGVHLQVGTVPLPKHCVYSLSATSRRPTGVHLGSMASHTHAIRQDDSGPSEALVWRKSSHKRVV